MDESSSVTWTIPSKIRKSMSKLFDFYVLCAMYIIHIFIIIYI